MTLEPKGGAPAGESENLELRAMSRRFWVSTALSVPLFALAMSEAMFPESFQKILPMGWTKWIQLSLGTPVVLWGGWPFFVRGWQSVKNRSLNMFTLIAIGTGVAYPRDRLRQGSSAAPIPPTNLLAQIAMGHVRLTDFHRYQGFPHSD